MHLEWKFRRGSWCCVDSWAATEAKEAATQQRERTEAIKQFLDEHKIEDIEQYLRNRKAEKPNRYGDSNWYALH